MIEIKYYYGYARNRCHIRTFFQRTSAPEELPENKNYKNVPTAAEPFNVFAYPHRKS